MQYKKLELFLSSIQTNLSTQNLTRSNVYESLKMDRFTLNKLLKEAQLIQTETFRQKLSRRREKTMGYMWEAEMEVKLIDGLRLIFYFWHHFHDDDGEEWYPSQKQ